MNSNESISPAKIIAKLREAEAHLHDYLNTLNPAFDLPSLQRLWLWLSSDPVRTKNLEEIATHLHNISFLFAQDTHEQQVPIALQNRANAYLIKMCPLTGEGFQ